MTGVILYTGTKWILAHNIPAIPQLDSYLQDTESGIMRYTIDCGIWFEYLQKASIIDLSFDMSARSLSYCHKYHGLSIEYALSSDGQYLYLADCTIAIGNAHSVNHTIVVSRYNEDIYWVQDYSSNITVYNKGQQIADMSTIISDNFGGNQYDICRFIYDNYDNLPESIVFIQGNPFDHCCKSIFDKLVDNVTFTSLEDYTHIAESDMHRKGPDGGYMEYNNSWFIEAHNTANGLWCKFPTFDSFMHSLFSDYEHLEWIRFAPGSQYIVTRENCLRYSREFWKKLMTYFPTTKVNGGTEAHLVERALWYIFTGKYTAIL